MTITRVSTSLTFSRTVSDYSSLQVKEADLTKQISSGFKADNFIDIGKDLREVINIESSVRSLDGYIDSNNAVISRLSIMDDSLEQMYEVMAELKQNLIIENTNPENLDLANLATTALNQIASNLDVQQGSRYLFSGSKITEAPSGDIRINSNVNESTFEKNLRYYRGDSLKLTANASPSFEVEYGITGDSQAFQDLFAAAHLAIAGDQDSSGRSQVILEEAQNLIDSGLDALLGIRGQIGGDINSLENINSQNSKVKTQLEIRYSDLLSTDIAEATIEQSLNQTIIQATLQNFASISRLNLADFL